MGEVRAVECPACARDGEQSSVLELPSEPREPVKTFQDDDGMTHTHQGKPARINYRCSRGHEFSVEEATPCPTCGWKATH